MKDKLIRYNHKRPYYIFKKTLFAFAFIFASSVAIAIPVSFSIRYINETIKTDVVETSLTDENTLIY